MKMAAKSKKRLVLAEKTQKLDKLELKDVICSICQSILVEPVTLPCSHVFCQRCFNGSIENNALCCPLCRLRIGSWLRTATKQKSVVNNKLWDFLKFKFHREISAKLKGEDIILPEELPERRVSAPGEIRSEYEAELKRIQEQRLLLEQKQYQETELLIKKIHQEEIEAQKRYEKQTKEDEILARQIQKEKTKAMAETALSLPKEPTPKPKMKAMRIDSYLCKQPAVAQKSPLLTDDNTSTDGSTPNNKIYSKASPEIVPSYAKPLKNIIDKKNKSDTSLWNKENGESEKNQDLKPSHKNDADPDDNTIETKRVNSLLVSLPLPAAGVLQHKSNALDNRHLETGSVDSMHQELCFFKPIKPNMKTSLKSQPNNIPLRVPCQRPGLSSSPIDVLGEPPSRAQYLEGLCRLRNLSLSNNVSSAFVIALNILRVDKENPSKGQVNSKTKTKRPAHDIEPMVTAKRSAHNKSKPVTINGITKPNAETSLRRTRSMGSMSKNENETTPKKARLQIRISHSERKPYLRSDSKKSEADKTFEKRHQDYNNVVISSAVKNLSSPFKTCDVKMILQEQLRIEKIIKQEKEDLEFARRMDAECNGRRRLRRLPVKRQVTLTYALRPAKKLKV